MKFTGKTYGIIVGGLLGLGLINRVFVEPQKLAATAAAKVKTDAEAQRQTEAHARVLAAALEAFKGSQDIGTITAWKPNTRECFVDGGMWLRFTYQEKQDFVKMVSWASEATTTLPQVTLRDANSGHELANYGVFSGVTIK